MFRHSDASEIGILNLGGDVGDVTVTMYDYEGKTMLPHVHLVNDKFNCSICLTSAKYFIHDKKCDTLTKEQMIIFNDFMHKTYIDDMIMWNKAWSEWLTKPNNMRTFAMYENAPDYSNIEGQLHGHHKKGMCRSIKRSTRRMASKEIRMHEIHSIMCIEFMDMSGYGKVRISMEEREGKRGKPHFHLETSDKRKICSISLEKPAYYIHTTDENFTKLTDVQKKELNERLCEVGDFGYIIFQELWQRWFHFNVDRFNLIDPTNIDIIDYSNLDGCICSNYKNKHKVTRKKKKNLKKGPK